MTKNGGAKTMAQRATKAGTKAEGFTIERTYKAPLETLWSLWTTKEGVESWWGPEGFVTEVRTLDLRPGGAFDYEMTATGAEQVEALKGLGLPLTTSSHNVYKEVRSREKLVLKGRIDFIPDVPPYDLEMAVEFRPTRGGTKLVFTSQRMHNAQFQELSRQGQAEQLEKLARVVAALDPSGPTKSKTEMRLQGDREILITRVFNAPRDRVYRAHADPRALVEWWGPRGYATEVRTWEPRPGGAWRIVQHDLEGREHGFRGTFQEVVPPERLTWTFEYEGTPGHVSTQANSFEALPGGKARLTVRVVFANQADREGMVASGMEWGMRQSHERLEELLARGG